ncbi:amidase family protein [Dactylonectria estremocensis]|uniref:Amidase family protein n=1 Tax=Dactylonectria estremocensis TaxID=1079267 RepID=A0A9P9FLV0_9HYPO|nr:amidase family protein [Dactylonectria estremocensis]
MMEPWSLTASETLAQIRSGNLSVEAYAKSLLGRILTRNVPTQHNSPLYEKSFPKVDAASVKILRHASSLIFSKTTTTEFTAIHIGPGTHNPQDPTCIPGGSSVGSGAAVALGTQTGGSQSGQPPLLQAHGAIFEQLDLDGDFARLDEWHRVVLHSEGRTAFLSNYRNVEKRNRKTQLAAFDGIAKLRPRMDKIAGRYAAIVTPSVPDEAPVGLESTGSHVFCSMWTALHNPVLDIPGFQGHNGMPIGVSLVAPRYRNRHLLKAGNAVSEIFEAEGGWKPQVYE